MAQSFHSSNQTQNSIWVLFSLQIKRSVANTWSSQISRRRVYFHELKMFKASKNNVGTWNSCYRLKLRLLWIVKIKIRRFPYSRWGLRFCWSLRCPTESHDGRMSQTGSAAFNYNRQKSLRLNYERVLQWNTVWDFWVDIWKWNRLSMKSGKINNELYNSLLCDRRCGSFKVSQFALLPITLFNYKYQTTIQQT